MSTIVSYPRHMQRTWIVRHLPEMSTAEFLRWRAEYLGRHGDNQLVWARIYAWEGLLQPSVRRELNRRGERA